MSFVKRKNGEVIEVNSDFKKILDSAAQHVDKVFRDEDLFPDNLVEDFRRTDHHALQNGLLHVRPEFIGNSGSFHGWYLTAKVKASGEGNESFIFGVTQSIGTWDQSNALSRYCPERISPIIRYIEENYTTAFQVKEMARHFGLSTTGLEKMFKSHYSVTPLHFIRRYRVYRAGLEIQQKEDPLSRIAARNGFAAPSHLSTEFKKFTGLSPNQCRNS